MSDPREPSPSPNSSVRAARVEPVVGLPAEAVPPRAQAGTGGSAAPDADETLLPAYAAGDAEAFAQLYDRHARATWRFIRHRLGPANEAAADAVLEESWIDVALQAPHIPGRQRWSPWLFALVRRRVLAHLAKPGAAADEPVPAEPLAPDADPEARALAFLGGLAHLPAPAREAAVLHVETGLDGAAIAAVIDEPAGPVEIRLREALARLAEFAGEQGAHTDSANVSRAYAHAWALRDASSRGPSAHARHGALATARAVTALRRDGGEQAPGAVASAPAPVPAASAPAPVPAASAPAPVPAAPVPPPPAPAPAAPVPVPVAPRPVPHDDGEQPDPFLAALTADLESVLHGDPRRATPHSAAAAPAPRASPQPAAAVPGPRPEPREPRLSDDPAGGGATASGARPAAAVPGSRPPAPPARPSPALRAATVAVVALAAGIGGWLLRDKLGPGVLHATLDGPARAPSQAAGATPPHATVDEALVRAEAALARLAEAGPAASAAGSNPLAAAVALASAPEPRAEPASTATPPAPGVADAARDTRRVAVVEPASVPTAATRASSQARPVDRAGTVATEVADGPSAVQGRASYRTRAGGRHETPAPDLADAAAAAEARANAFPGKPGGEPGRRTSAEMRAARRESAAARAAAEAAQARADAFLAGEAASSSSR